MVKKQSKRSTKRLKRLLDEYDSLLMLSEVLGVTVSEEGETIKDIISEHPEYAGYMKGEEIEAEDGTTVNPRLHITVEAVVQRQMAKGEPREVREAYLTLLKEGVDPHESRHAIGRIFIEMVWLMLQNKLSADPNEYYCNQLKALMRLKLKHPVFSSL